MPEFLSRGKNGQDVAGTSNQRVRYLSNETQLEAVFFWHARNWLKDLCHQIESTVVFRRLSEAEAVLIMALDKSGLCSQLPGG